MLCEHTVGYIVWRGWIREDILEEVLLKSKTLGIKQVNWENQARQRKEYKE